MSDAGYDNRKLLTKELGDVAYAVRLLVACGDIALKDVEAVERNNIDKAIRGLKHPHHQEWLVNAC